MKIGGRKLLLPQPEVLVIPRPSTLEDRLNSEGKQILEDGKPIQDEIDNNIVFMAQQVSDYSELDQYAPLPTPPLIKRRGSAVETPDTKDPTYLKAMQRRASLQTDFMVLKSLQATPGLEWETVNMTDSSTWHNWMTELAKDGISDIEQQKIIQIVANANSLNEQKYDEAKKSFLAGRGVQR